MPGQDNIKQDIATTKLLETLVTTYEEIAVMRIQKVRSSVIATRAFHKGLNHLYNNVKATQSTKVDRILNKKKQSRLANLPFLNFKKSQEQESGDVKKKQGALLISTDKSFSGSITTNVFKAFLKFIDNNPHEVLITGRIGKDRLSQVRPQKEITYFDLPEKSTGENLRELIKNLKQYDELIVFHGKFINLVKQEPAEIDLTGKTADDAIKKFQKNHADIEFFLFEPSLEEVIYFFDTEIFAMLFKQMTHEAHLAQLGSRITAMEKASHNIDKKLQELTIEERQIIRAETNSKQRQRMASMSLWY